MKTFVEAVRSKDFTITAEPFLTSETTPRIIAEQARLLRDHVDGVLVRDNQEGKLHMAPLAAASLFMANGVDAIMQMSCRNRNRIALLADLLGAAALGVSSLVLVRGNRVPEGFDPRPKAVFDVDAAELIATAAKLKADDHLPSLPDFFIGSVVTAHEPEPGWVPEKLLRKADSGVQFALIYICMDTNILRSYMAHLVATGLTRRLDFFVTLPVIASADDARWLQNSLPHHKIPDDVITRLESAKDAEQEGVSICAEQLRELQDIPGIQGAHLLATRNLATINAAMEAAGLANDPGR